MRRLILTLLLLATLVAIAVLGERLIADDSRAPEPPASIALQTGEPLPDDAPPLSLKLSTRLGAPGPATRPAATKAVPAPAFDPLRLVLLGLASLAGMAFVRLWWTPAQPAEAPARVAPERVAERAHVAHEPDAQHQRELEALSQSLSVAQDDLKTAQSAHADLLSQVSALDQSLAESQQQSATLTATVAEREHELVTLRAELDSITAHDADATSSVTDLSARLRALDDDGVEQRVINVQFEKALLEAREYCNHLTAQLEEQQAAVAMHETTIETLHQTIAADEAAIEQAKADSASAAREATELALELQALNEDLLASRDRLAERESELQELVQVRERLDAWQSTVDTYRNDLSARDARIDEFARRLDERDVAIADLKSRAEETDALRARLREQEAVARVLKDAADSMRLHKARSDERAAAIASLKSALDRERQHESRLRSQLGDLKRQHEASQTALGDANSDLFDARQALEVEQRRVSELEQQLADAHRDGADWQKAHTALEQSVTTLRDALLEDLTGVVEAGDAVHETLAAELPDVAATDAPAVDPEQLAELMATLRELHAAAQSESETAAGELADTLEMLAALETDGVRRAETGRALQQDRDELATLCRAVEAQAVRLTADFNAQSAEREAALADAATNAASRAATESALAELREHEQRLTEQVEALVAERNALSARATGLRAACDAAQAQATRRQVAVVSGQHREAALAHEVETLGSALAQRTEQAKQREARINELSESLQAHKAAAEAEVRTVSEANLALREAMRDVRNEADGDIQRLRSAVEQAEATAAALGDKLEQARGVVGHQRQRIAGLSAELQTAQRALEKLEAKAAPGARVVDRAVEVPILTRRASTPPVLTRAVNKTPNDADDDG